MCPFTAAIAAALVPGVKAEEIRLGQLMGLSISLAIAVLARLVLTII